MRQYICDRCGKLVDEPHELTIVELGPSKARFNPNPYKPFWSGDLCNECFEILHEMRSIATANAEWRFSLMQNSIKEEYL